MADSLRISLRFEFFSKLIVVKERQPANAPASIVSTLAGILIDTILHPENTPPSFPPLRVLSFDPCSKPMFSKRGNYLIKGNVHFALKKCGNITQRKGRRNLPL